jgi:hypothetical protein
LACAAAILVLSSCSVPVAGTPSAAAGPAPTSSPVTASSTATPSSNSAVVVNAVVPGWNTVRSTERAALYDVPPAWTVNSEDTIVGYETNAGKLLVAASGSASIGDNACGKNTSLALAGVKHSTGPNLIDASTNEAKAWADAAFRDANDKRPTLTTGQPEHVTTLTGKPAVIVKVDATAAHATGNCGTQGAAYAISATGFTGKLGPTAILVIVAGTGFDRAIPDDQIRQILTTLRPET